MNKSKEIREQLESLEVGQSLQLVTQAGFTPIRQVIQYACKTLGIKVITRSTDAGIWVQRVEK